MHSIGRDVESFPALIPLVPLRGAVVYKEAGYTLGCLL